MTIEIAMPEDWTPGQCLAVRQLLQHAVNTAQPVVGLVRKDATPEQLHDAYVRIEAMIRESGLEPAQTRVS
jgi:hypothetical protein